VTTPIDTSPVSTDEVLLEGRNLTKEFRTGTVSAPWRRHTRFRAVDDVSLTLRRGKVTALVGQSGSGKSTVARLLAQLYPLSAGEIRIDGQPVTATRGRAFTRYCSDVQLILQDPFSSLNPVHRVGYILGRVLRIHQSGLDAEAVEKRSLALLEQVNLTPAPQYLHRFPHELSGGERQRVSFARALAAGPRVLLADEPVSMLDVTIRKEMLDLLDRLRRDENLAVLYITHDLGSAEAYADETLVMYRGKVVEHGPSRDLVANPQHEYTQRLLAAAPDPRRRLA
jgi:peptide/nickel transport system ATP-binding protein